MRSDAITLDTNVLEHFFRTEPTGINSDGHVTDLLTKIIRQRRALCEDSKQRMANELAHRLSHYKEHSEMENFQFILRGLAILGREPVDIDHRSALMNCIDGCVPGGTEQSDKVIIYVACASGTLLVSNNDRHITNHATCLKRCARRNANSSPEFWNSRTANANL